MQKVILAVAVLYLCGILSVSATSFQFSLSKSGTSIPINGASLNLDKTTVFQEDFVQVSGSKKVNVEMDEASADVSYFLITGYNPNTNTEYVVQLLGDNSDFCIWIESDRVHTPTTHNISMSGSLTSGSCSDTTRSISWSPITDFFSCGKSTGSSAGASFSFSMAKTGVNNIDVTGASLNINSTTKFTNYIARVVSSTVQIQSDINGVDVSYFSATGYDNNTGITYIAHLSGNKNQACYWVEVTSNGTTTVVENLTRSGSLTSGSCSDGTHHVSWGTVSDFEICQGNYTIVSAVSTGGKSGNSGSNSGASTLTVLSGLAALLAVFAMLF